MNAFDHAVSKYLGRCGETFQPFEGLVRMPSKRELVLLFFYKYAFLNFQHALNSAQQKILEDRGSISCFGFARKRVNACEKRIVVQGSSALKTFKERECWGWIKHLSDRVDGDVEGNYGKEMDIVYRN